MFALLSLVVCLSDAPAVCETVTPDYVDQGTGRAPSLSECLGVGGQTIARQWIGQHPGYRLSRIQCSIANDQRRLREQVPGRRA